MVLRLWLAADARGPEQARGGGGRCPKTGSVGAPSQGLQVAAAPFVLLFLGLGWILVTIHGTDPPEGTTNGGSGM